MFSLRFGHCTLQPSSGGGREYKDVDFITKQLLCAVSRNGRNPFFVLSVVSFLVSNGSDILAYLQRGIIGRTIKQREMRETRVKTSGSHLDP